jgi:hypothetical protein
LKKLSKGNEQTTNEREVSLTGGLSEEALDAFGASQSHEGFGNSQDRSQLSLTSSPSGQLNLASNQYGTVSLPEFSTQWHPSSPENDTRK